MKQNYKVFTEDKEIFIDSFKHDNAKILPELKDWKDPTLLFKELENSNSSQFQLNLSDFGVDFFTFKNLFPQIYAAGGIVSYDSKLLMIYRNGKWDLPKGWIEENEFAAKAALREVGEECGKMTLEITDLVPIITHHLYRLKNEIVWKETKWFKMKVVGDFDLFPQRSEGISNVEFVLKNEVSDRLKNSFPMLRHLCENL